MDVKQLILPGACFFCLSETMGAWCEECEQDFITDIDRCPVCAQNTTGNKICGSCLRRQSYINRTEILFNYQYPANYLIKAFKFYSRTDLARYFAEALAKRLVNKTPLPKVLLPVPLHKKRQRGRGYNQSRLFAAQLAKCLGLKVDPTVCSRVKHGVPQSTLAKKIRRQNIKGAFTLSRASLPDHIAIVDDVITTGSTINELAALLKRAGCLRIDAWAIAKTSTHP